MSAETAPWILYAAAALVALLVLGLALWLLFQGIAGAIFMFGAAAAQGFVGLAAFVALWVFLFPVMAVVAILLGAFVNWAGADTTDREARKARAAALWRHKHLGEPLPPKPRAPNVPPDDPVERNKWANRLPPYDDPPPDGHEECHKWSNRLPPYDR